MRIQYVLLGSALGSGLTFLLDPDRGRSRRAYLQEKAAHYLRKAMRFTGKRGRDVAHRAHGTVATATGSLKGRHVDDDTLAERVRAQLGRHTTHPGSINVEVNDRVACLTGPILRREVDDVLCAAKDVKGIRDVENQLDIHDEPANVPGLQG